jgi:hypothetical protein
VIEVDARLQSFLNRSAGLTGFSHSELLFTGVADRLLAAVDACLPAGVLDRLLAFDGEDEALLADPELGPVARNLVVAWYCGTWTALPDDWRATYGAAAGDTNHVLFPEAYLAGLQWVAAGAHPPGASEQGYGSWAVPRGEIGTPAALKAAVRR